MMPWVATLTAPPSPVAPSVAPTMSGASIEEPMLLMKPPPPPIDWISTAFAPAPLVTIFAFCVSAMLPPSPPAPPAAPAESVMPPAPMLAPSIEEMHDTPPPNTLYHIYETQCRRRRPHFR